MLKGEEELDYEEEPRFQTSTPLNNRLARSKSNGTNINHHFQDQYSFQHRNSYHQPHYRTAAAAATSTSTSTNTTAARSTTSLDSRDQLIEELQKSLSQVAFENEELKHELNRVRRDIEDLNAENQKLYQDNQQKDVMRQKMGEKLSYVTHTAFTLCEKLSALKCRYYEEKSNAWLNGK